LPSLAFLAHAHSSIFKRFFFYIPVMQVLGDVFDIPQIRFSPFAFWVMSPPDHFDWKHIYFRCPPPVIIVLPRGLWPPKGGFIA